MEETFDRPNYKNKEQKKEFWKKFREDVLRYWRGLWKKFREDVLRYWKHFKIESKKHKLRLALALILEFFIIYLIKNLPTGGYYSPYPLIVLYLSLLSGLLLILTGSIYEHGYKILGGILGLILTLQVVYPVFTPKVSIGEASFLYGRITTKDGSRQDINTVNIPIKIKPPLIPFDRSVEIPLALSNLTYVNYRELLNPGLFSGIYVENDISAKFYIYTDGWKYDELNAVLVFQGDRYPPLRAWMQDTELNPTGLYETRKNDKVQYYGHVYFQNHEGFEVCFDDYEFTILNESFSGLQEIKFSNYMVSLCDNRDFDGCEGLRSSIHGGNFSQPLYYDDLINSEKIILKTWIHCLEGNTSTSQYLVFTPISQ